MSKESVTEFLATVGQDPAQQEAVKQTVAGKEDQAAAVVTAASERGFEFTAEEFVEVNDALHRHEQGELSDDELEQVAGGLVSKPGGGTTGQKLPSIGRNLDWIGLRY